MRVPNWIGGVVRSAIAAVFLLAGLGPTVAHAQPHVGVRSAFVVTSPGVNKDNVGVYLSAGYRQREVWSEKYRGRAGLSLEVGSTVLPAGWRATSWALFVTNTIGPENDILYLLLSLGYAVDKVYFDGGPSGTVHNALVGFGLGGRVTPDINVDFEIRFAAPNPVVGSDELMQMGIRVVRFFR